MPLHVYYKYAPEMYNLIIIGYALYGPYFCLSVITTASILLMYTNKN